MKGWRDGEREREREKDAEMCIVCVWVVMLSEHNTDSRIHSIGHPRWGYVESQKKRHEEGYRQGCRGISVSTVLTRKRAKDHARQNTANNYGTFTATLNAVILRLTQKASGNTKTPAIKHVSGTTPERQPRATLGKTQQQQPSYICCHLQLPAWHDNADIGPTLKGIVPVESIQKRSEAFATQLVMGTIPARSAGRMGSAIVQTPANIYMVASLFVTSLVAFPRN